MNKLLALLLTFCFALCLNAAMAETVEHDPQPITAEILTGVWELDHVDYSGTTITAEDWVSFFGEKASMEFTPTASGS